MSGVGFSELIILFLIGLIVLGPERLPRVANQLGSWLGQARRMTRVMKRQLEEELDLEGAASIKPTYPKPQPTVQKTPVDSVNTKPASQANSPSQETPASGEYAPGGQFDDTYSPAHDADAPGTGVGQSATNPPGDEETKDGETAEPVVADATDTGPEKEKLT